MKRKMRGLGILSLSLFLIGLAALAEAQATPDSRDKTSYTIFRPTPTELMREFATDRPDKTESAYTVDAGHFQFETDLINWVRDEKHGLRTRSTLYGATNFKVGVTNSADLQIIIAPVVRDTTEGAGRRRSESGFGDTLVRYKWNVFGNDGGAVAMALMPYVKVPTAGEGLGNQKWEGGLIIPFALALPREWSLGFMFEIDRVQNRIGGGQHTEFVTSAALGRDIVRDLGGYVEFFSASSPEAGAEWVATVDLGLTYQFISNWQLDAGVNLGVTDAADDINPFFGLSARF